MIHERLRALDTMADVNCIAKSYLYTPDAWPWGLVDFCAAFFFLKFLHHACLHVDGFFPCLQMLCVARLALYARIATTEV